MTDPRRQALDEARQAVKAHANLGIWCEECDEPAPCKAGQYAQRTVEQLEARISAATPAAE